jgi:hypothetical protein
MVKVGNAIREGGDEGMEAGKAGIKTNTELNALEGYGKALGKGEKIGTGAIQ